MTENSAENDNFPKILKYAEGDCYGLKFGQLEQCKNCWLSGSCESNYKAHIKKLKAADKPKPQAREKKYKKTDKYREWY